MVTLGNTPTHASFCVLMVSVVTLVHSQPGSELCDIQMWYLDLVSEGILSGSEVTWKQTVLKVKIEKLLNQHTSGEKSDGMVACTTLRVYENLLQQAGQPDPVPEPDGKTDPNPDGKPDSNTNGELDKKIDSGGKESRESEKESEAKQGGVSEEGDDTDFDETDFGDEDNDADSGEGKEKEVESQGKDEEKTDQEPEDVEYEEKMVFDPKRGYVKVRVEIKKEQPAHEDKAIEREEGNQVPSKDTKVEKMTQNESTNEPVEEPVKEPPETQKEDVEDTNEVKVSKKTRTVEEYKFDPLKGYVKVVKEIPIEDDGEEAVQDAEVQKPEVDYEKPAADSEKPDSNKPEPDSNKPEPDSNKPEPETDSDEKVQEAFPAEPETGSDEKEPETFPAEQESDSDEKEPEAFPAEPETDTDEKEPEAVSDENKPESELEYDDDEEEELYDGDYNDEDDESLYLDNCDRTDVCTIYCYYTFTQGQCLDHYPDIVFKENSPQVEDSKVEAPTESESLSESAFREETIDGEIPVPTNDEHSKEERREHFEEPEVKQGVDLEEGAVGELKQSGEMSEEARQGNTNLKDNDQKEEDSNKEERRDQEQSSAYKVDDITADLYRFELKFQQRTAEYATKIQSLEIMIMKLENQLLAERLHEQNSTGSFSKLETHILRLENELLKLNQSYAHLQSENDLLKSRQRHYLELSHDKGVQNDNSTKHYELITKQQDKISELTSLLMNHSVLFEKLQDRSQTLETQNQALYQIVMNQTALISSIMKKMQELSEENLKQRHETQDLRSQIQMHANSDRLLQKLDSLVSGVTTTSSPLVDDGKPIEEEERYSSNDFFPKSPDAIVSQKLWTCDEKRQTQFCLLFSFYLSPCPPNAFIYWIKCPFFMKDISKDEEKKEEKQDVKIQLDSVETKDATVEERKSDPQEDTAKPPNIDVPQQEHEENTQQQATPGSNQIPQSEGSANQQESSEKQPPSQTPDASTEKSAGNDNTNTKGQESSQAKGQESPEQSAKVKVEAPTPLPENPEDRELLYTSSSRTPKPKDCHEYYMQGKKTNGMYKIYLVGLEKNLQVYCDMKNGGWTVLMRRKSGELDFYNDWNDYKKGFGGVYGEYWLGNDNFHYLTNQGHYRLRVDLHDYNNDEVFAEYDNFWIDNEDSSYRLHIGGYKGNAGDGFDKHNNMKFSTRDVDNDLVAKELKEYDSSCAKRFHGGWWYYKCYMSNLTGKYYSGGEVPDKKFDGVSWKPWKKPHISLKTAIMKIKPISVR